MLDREFCNRTAVLAAEVAGERFAHVPRGASDYPAFGKDVVLFFGNDGPQALPGQNPVVAKLREFLAIEEVGITELGFGTALGGRSWALVAESRRDVEYCRRLIWKAFRESGPHPSS